jgi:hypothetical protein
VRRDNKYPHQGASDRRLFLLERIERGIVRGTFYPRNAKRASSRFYRISSTRYGSPLSQRQPSQRELTELLTFELAKEVRTPGNGDTYDTSTKPHKQIGQGCKLQLTNAGQSLLDRARGEGRIPEAT